MPRIGCPSRISSFWCSIISLSRLGAMPADDLLQHLRELEVALHQSHVREDRARLDELLHESFAEFGRSGRSYSRADILEFLALELPPGPVWSQDFTLAEIAEGIALLTYKSAYVDANGELRRHTLRSSLWQRTARGWQMRFHQGTPTDAFAKSSRASRTTLPERR